jgi:hypothetical protein
MGRGRSEINRGIYILPAPVHGAVKRSVNSLNLDYYASLGTVGAGQSVLPIGLIVDGHFWQRGDIKDWRYVNSGDPVVLLCLTGFRPSSGGSLFMGRMRRQQFANRPDVVGQFGFHRWRHPERLVNTAEVVPAHKDRHGRLQVHQLL